MAKSRKTGVSGSGGKTPWSKIATGKGKAPADSFTKGKFGSGKSTASKGGKGKGGKSK